MAKPDTRFKQTTNRLLEHIEDAYPPGAALPGEEALATVGEVSRTTIRAALDHIEGMGIVEPHGRPRHVLRRPRRADYFEVSELVTRSDQIQRALMARILRRDLLPGQAFSETELAREAGASTPSVREFLIGFSRYDLIERKPRGGWRLRSFDSQFAGELADMRDMLELRAIDHLHALPEGDPLWLQIESLAARHRQLELRFHQEYHEFPALDREVHATLIAILGNRFANSFYDIISFIFHYHYQWEKHDEKERYATALREHLEILDALAARDFGAARASLSVHLGTARRTLLRSIAVSQSGDQGTE